MKTIIGTKADVTKELTAQVADVLARKPDANIAISVVDLPAEVLDALAASDIAFDKATLFQACEYCGAAGKGTHAVGAAFSPLTAAKPFAAVHAPDPDADAEHAADYDAAIQAAGGLDLVILGLGERGHVAGRPVSVALAAFAQRAPKPTSRIFFVPRIVWMPIVMPCSGVCSSVAKSAAMASRVTSASLAMCVFSPKPAPGSLNAT